MPSPTPRADASRVAHVLALITLLSHPSLSRADDDDNPPPVDPGPGYEGIFPNPPLPPNFYPDQTTSPWGLTSIFNTPAIRTGQSFRTTGDHLSWVGFVFQHNPQPNTTVTDGRIRIELYSSLDRNTGALAGLLAESEELTLAPNQTKWLIFDFPQPVPLTPNITYYFNIAQYGYGCGVGGRSNSVYPGGSAIGYWFNQFGVQRINWDTSDLIFAFGTESPFGDANRNGRIDPDDYALLDRALTTNPLNPRWADGDFNDDDLIDHQDYLLIDTTFLQTKAQGWQSLGSSFLAQRASQFGPNYVSQLLAQVPEPAALPALLAGFTLLIRRRRR